MPSDSPLLFGRTNYEMTLYDKIIIIYKIEQTKLNTIFYQQTAKISALSSLNVDKCVFLTGENVLSEKKL